MNMEGFLLFLYVCILMMEMIEPEHSTTEQP